VNQAARISDYQLTDDSLLLTGICPTCQDAATSTQQMINPTPTLPAAPAALQPS